MEEQRREMEVAAGSQIFHVKIGGRHLGHRSWKGENVTPCPVVQENRDAGGWAACDALDAAKIDPFFGEPVEGDTAQRVAAEAGDEAHRKTERSEVVRKNSGGAAQGKPEIVAQQFPLQRHFLRKAIENQIEINLTGNRNIETFLHLSSRSWSRSTGVRSNSSTARSQ